MVTSFLFTYSRASRTGHPPHEASSLIAFRNFDEEMKHSGVWESDQGSTSTIDNPRDNLASLYRPPFHLMFHGSFEKVKGFSLSVASWCNWNIYYSVLMALVSCTGCLLLFVLKYRLMYDCGNTCCSLNLLEFWKMARRHDFRVQLGTWCWLYPSFELSFHYNSIFFFF